MEKNILDQYEDACRLADETQHDLQHLRSAKHEILHDSVKGSNPEFPYQPMSFHVAGISYTVYDNPEAIARAEELLAERLALVKQLQLQVEEWMNRQPPKIQRIVRLKYIRKMTWEQVAANMGMGSPDAPRKYLDRYLEDDC